MSGLLILFPWRGIDQETVVIGGIVNDPGTERIRHLIIV